MVRDEGAGPWAFVEEGDEVAPLECLRSRDSVLKILEFCLTDGKEELERDEADRAGLSVLAKRLHSAIAV